MEQAKTTPGAEIWAKFLNINEKGKTTGINQNALFEYLMSTENLMIWKKKPYIYEGGVYIKDVEGIRPGVIIQDKITELIHPDWRGGNATDSIYKRIEKTRAVYRTEINLYPAHWINFKNGMLDVKTGELHPHDPKFFSINQLPWDWNPNADYGEDVENFLNFALYKENARELFLEFCGLMMTTETAFQKYLMLIGQGGNGKSVLLNLISNAIGDENLSMMKLDKITGNRFALTEMVGKLANICADLRTGSYKDSENLKMLTGNDKMNAEPKGLEGFNFKPYAKLLFSANEVPRVIGEESDAIYRRMMVLTIDRKPEKPDINLEEKLKKQTPYFIRLCVEALRRLYERGEFINCPDSIEAVANARRDNNSVDAFLQDECILGEGYEYERTPLYNLYTLYCTNETRTPKSRPQFYGILRDKGFKERKSGNYRYIVGLTKKTEAPEAVQNETLPTFSDGQKITEEGIKTTPDVAGILEGIKQIQAQQQQIASWIAGVLDVLQPETARR